MLEEALTSRRHSPAAAPAISPRRRRAAIIVPAAILAIVGLVEALPALRAVVQFDRQAIAAGQWWRLVTCHFAHFGWFHALADAGCLAVLLHAGWRRSRLAPVAAGAACVAVGVSVCLWAPQIAIYRGLSGVGFGLLAWVLTVGVLDGGRWNRPACAAGLGAVLVKSVLEAVTGGAIGPTSAPPGVAVVGAAHLAGITVGVLLALPAGLPALRAAMLTLFVGMARLVTGGRHGSGHDVPAARLNSPKSNCAGMAPTPAAHPAPAPASAPASAPA